jgi:hypothetical protein
MGPDPIHGVVKSCLCDGTMPPAPPVADCSEEAKPRHWDLWQSVTTGGVRDDKNPSCSVGEKHM